MTSIGGCHDCLTPFLPHLFSEALLSRLMHPSPRFNYFYYARLLLAPIKKWECTVQLRIQYSCEAVTQCRSLHYPATNSGDLIYRSGPPVGRTSTPSTEHGSYHGKFTSKGLIITNEVLCKFVQLHPPWWSERTQGKTIKLSAFLGDGVILCWKQM